MLKCVAVKTTCHVSEADRTGEDTHSLHMQHVPVNPKVQGDKVTVARQGSKLDNDSMAVQGTPTTQGTAGAQ